MLTPTISKQTSSPKHIEMQASTGAWNRVSSSFVALKSAVTMGTSDDRPGQPSAPSGPSARQQVASFKNGWTVTMVEPLLDLCFVVFFKYQEATLPLLPEILLLHQVSKKRRAEERRREG